MASKKSKISRREFLKRGGQATAGTIAGASAIAAGAAPAIGKNILGANDRINMAVVGLRSRGGYLMQSFAGMDNVQVKTIVDIDENLFARRAEECEKLQGVKPGMEWDMRKAYEDKEIDAVAIGAPNHWHALGTIWAAQNGKHVYVEKPSSHNVWEGRKMVEAARKHNVLVQVGFQNRSRGNTNAAMKFLHEGKLGKIYYARGLCFKPRNDIGRYPDGPLKPGETFSFTVGSSAKEPPYTESYLSKVHYDMWLGPAPNRPFNRNHFHYNWHWHREYGNGDTGNQGPHQFDIARWGLNKDEYPVKVRSFGGMFVYDSSQTTPNTQTSIFEYADGTIMEFCTRGLLTNPEGLPTDAQMTRGTNGAWKTHLSGEITIGDLFFGSEGWMQIDAGGNWQTFFGRKNEPGPNSADISEEEYDAMNLAGGGDSVHFQNFIKALRSGKQSDLTCDIEEGHRSSALPLIANVSYYLGRELAFDGEKEKFVNDREANKLLTRNYRKPYIVPDKV